jgi:uncharacterized protein (DUF2062 family)
LTFKKTMLPTLGLQEFVYAIAMGVAVGVGLGLIRRFDPQRTSAMLVTVAFWCAVVGALGLWVWISLTGSDGFDREWSLLAPLMLVGGGGASLVLGSPVALVLWYSISRFRHRNAR